MKYFKSFLAVWGAISGLLALLAISFFSFHWYFGNKIQIDTATKSDVRFVLNWPSLGDERIESVLKSYESARSLSGDHLDAYEILTTGITIEDFQNKDTWHRGDDLDAILEEGVDLITSTAWSDDLNWFPKKETIRSKEIYVFSWSVVFHNRRATAAKLVFAKPSENKIYYASVKI